APAPPPAAQLDEPRAMPKRTRRGGRRQAAPAEVVEPIDSPVAEESALEDDLAIAPQVADALAPAVEGALAPVTAEFAPVEAGEAGAGELFGIEARPATPEELAAIARAGGIVAPR